MKIKPVDPDARVLTEDEIRRLLAEPHLVRLGLIDQGGWPTVYPLWFLHEGDRLLVSAGADSRKTRLARANPRGFYCVDVGTGVSDAPRGVRGRCDVKVIGDDVEAAVAVMEKLLRRYLGSLDGDMQRGFIESARNNETVVLELTPHSFGAWGY